MTLYIHELIGDLQRFPQGATVLLCNGQILVDAHPYNVNGNSIFDARCANSELPEELRAASERTRKDG